MKKNDYNTTYVCKTGFPTIQDSQKYEEYLKSLNCTYLRKMSYSTHILIVNNVATQKYKMAKLTKIRDRTQINCVTIDWLIDSHKAKKMLDLDQYQIPTIFYGTTIGILGFNSQQNQKLKKLLQDNGSQVILVSDSDFQKQLQINAVISTEQTFQRLGQVAKNIKIPIVSIRWLEDSLKRKMCKFPRDYALNYQYLDNQSNIINLPKLQESVKTMSNTHMLLDTYQDIFSDVVLYIDGSVESNTVNALRNAVCAYGGIYLNEISPLVTHVLVNKITQQQYDKYLKFGNLLQVVRSVWLTDSIWMNSKLHQQDYQITQFQPSLLNFKKQNYNSNMFMNINLHEQYRNSISFASLPLGVGQLKRTKSISVSGNGNTKQAKNCNKIVIKKKVASEIFHKKYFYVDQSQKKSSQLYQLSYKIKQNGGSFLQDLKKWKGNAYFIMIDSPANQNIISKIQKVKDIICVSWRWVEACIKSSKFIDPKTNETFVFRPYHISTPEPKFMQYKFQIVGEEEKNGINIKNYKQLLSLLGSKNNTVNKSQVTHMLWVGKSEDKQKAIEQILQGSKYKQTIQLKKVDRIPIIDKEWLEKIHKTGNTVEYQPYLLN